MSVPLELGRLCRGARRPMRGFLPEKDSLEIGCGVEGIGRHGADLVVLQVQVFKRCREPFRDLRELVPSDVQ